MSVTTTPITWDAAQAMDLKLCSISSTMINSDIPQDKTASIKQGDYHFTTIPGAFNRAVTLQVNDETSVTPLNNDVYIVVGLDNTLSFDEAEPVLPIDNSSTSSSVKLCTFQQDQNNVTMTLKFSDDVNTFRVKCNADTATFKIERLSLRYWKIIVSEIEPTVSLGVTILTTTSMLFIDKDYVEKLIQGIPADFESRITCAYSARETVTHPGSFIVKLEFSKSVSGVSISDGEYNQNGGTVSEFSNPTGGTTSTIWEAIFTPDKDFEDFELSFKDSVFFCNRDPYEIGEFYNGDSDVFKFARASVKMSLWNVATGQEYKNEFILETGQQVKVVLKFPRAIDISNPLVEVGAGTHEPDKVSDDRTTFDLLFTPPTGSEGKKETNIGTFGTYLIDRVPVYFKRSFRSIQYNT
jgi:hypothetical protein